MVSDKGKKFISMILLAGVVLVVGMALTPLISSTLYTSSRGEFDETQNHTLPDCTASNLTISCLSGDYRNNINVTNTSFLVPVSNYTTNVNVSINCYDLDRNSNAIVRGLTALVPLMYVIFVLGITFVFVYVAIKDFRK